jgi:hypothetical protein
MASKLSTPYRKHSYVLNFPILILLILFLHGRMDAQEQDDVSGIYKGVLTLNFLNETISGPVSIEIENKLFQKPTFYFVKLHADSLFREPFHMEYPGGVLSENLTYQKYVFNSTGGRAKFVDGEWQVSFDRIEGSVVQTDVDKEGRSSSGVYAFKDYYEHYAVISDGQIYTDTRKMTSPGISFVATKAGMPEKETVESEYAIKASVSPKSLLPDGKSQAQVSAILYSYDPNSNKPGSPVEGEVLEFNIPETDGVSKGSLSSATAVTDANGMASVTYTAPNTILLSKLQLWSRDASSVIVSSETYNTEDIAYINFRSDRSMVFAEPAPGIVSEHCIIPPDRRFPANIKVYVEDDNLKSLPYTEVTFTLDNSDTVGMLRDAGGNEGSALTVLTDAGGWTGVQYYYHAGSVPAQPLTQRIEIKTAHMPVPMEARVSVGLNIIFASLENAYEGKGIISAGEQIPLRVKIKDAWHPGLDLSGIINYWGHGGKYGDAKLYARLEIEPISTVPDYLLDQLKLEKYPEEGFSENMSIRSFPDKGEINMLWMPSSTLKDYQGYPRIRPATPGNHYYIGRVSLVDEAGQEVFRTDHPARESYFNLQTDLPADAFQIFFISNPFGGHSYEAKMMLTALDVMGFGTVLSVVNAMDAINRGSTDELYGILFSEVKGAMLSKVKEGSAYKELAVDLYTGMALAEKVGLEIMRGETGVVTAFEATVFDKLMETFNLKAGQLVVVTGDGTQQLYEDNQGTNVQGSPIPVKEKSFVEDAKKNITSLKNGPVSIYIVPPGMKVRTDENSRMIRY